MAVVGFVGVGRMGGPMASRLLDAGYELCIYDVSAEAMKPFAARGAQIAASPAEVASQAEIVLVSLPTPDIVKLVATGGNAGIINGTKVRLMIDLSTTGPGVANEVAGKLAEQIGWVGRRSAAARTGAKADARAHGFLRRRSSARSSR